MQNIVHITDILILFCCVLGYRNYAFLDRAWKIIVLQLSLDLVAELLGLVLRQLKYTTSPVYNFYLPAELILLAVTANMFLKSVHWKRATFFFLALFFGVWLYDLWEHSLLFFTSRAYATEGIIICCLYLGLLLQLQRQDGYSSLLQHPLFWFCVAHLVYFGCVIPYFSLMDYLQANKPQLWHHLYIINPIMGVMRYLLVLLSFILIESKNRKKSVFPATGHE